MNNTSIYESSEAGLNSFYARIYSLVGMGITLSALIAAMMLYIFPENLIQIAYGMPLVYLGALILEVVLVFVATSMARKNSGAALPIFLAYSALNGFTLSFIVMRYAQTTVVSAFVTAALVFFAMSIIGRYTKKDLSGMRKALYAGLIGIVIAGLVNMFLGSGIVSLLISVVGVVIFSGLIAYDNQLIKNVYYQTGGNVGNGWAISMALSLYLDFINIFLYLLRLFGSRD
ncbi:Bax inhibitor-1/YccA family protein [Streptococcus caprae]|uniref:Bax inhibitor-1 family protein n=1 Tax=Streptococcus caprae TaxID=1640501 RepID=A0ABV8CYG7_9STRE